MEFQNNKHANALYVGDLAETVTDETLFKAFTAAGTVHSVRICRDIVSNKSLGYGYVNFETAENAERALRELNFVSIDGKPCRVARSQPEPTKRKTGEGNIVVKGLKPDLEDRIFHSFFARIGPVASSKLSKDEHGKLRGYGFVHFENAADAQRAVADYNGQNTELGVLALEAYLPHAERSKPTAPVTNLYVKNFPTCWTEETLHALFSSFGVVTSTCLSHDSRKRAFGFVNMETTDQAAAALTALSNRIALADGTVKRPEDETEEERTVTPLEDAPDRQFAVSKDEVPTIFRLYVSFAQPKTQRENALRQKFSSVEPLPASAAVSAKSTGVALYVKNLPDTVTDDKLREMFAKYGTVSTAHVFTIQNSSGNKVSRGAGVVTMADKEAATAAMGALHHTLLENNKPLIVSHHEKRDIRRQRLEMEHARSTAPHVHHSHPQQQQGGMAPFSYVHHHANVRHHHNNQYNPAHNNFANQYNQHNNYNRNRQHHNRNGNAVNPAMYMQNMQNMNMHMLMQQQMVRSHMHPSLRETIMNVPESERKQTLGEFIFAKVAALYPKEAPKITGMLVEMSVEELLSIVEDPMLLQAKVNEAFTVLSDAQNKQQ